MNPYDNVKKIGVISDTHIPLRRSSIPEKIIEVFRGVELIMHAGDITERAVIDELEKIAPVVAVRGNMDNGISDLPEKRIITVNNKFKIGIIHGYGSPTDIVEKIEGMFSGVDCVVFGHSHRAFNDMINGVLYFNPGSACDTFFTAINTVGILNVNDKITGEIVKI